MYTCNECGGSDVIKKGKNLLNGILRQRVRCKECGYNQYEPIDSIDEVDDVDDVVIPEFSNYPKKHKNANTWVITTALNDAPTNTQFFETLLTYCSVNNADLLIIPVVYKNEAYAEEPVWDSSLVPFFFHDNTYLLDDLRLLALTSISAIAANPLSGYDSLCKGMSLIVPSPQLMMKTVARNHIDKPAIIHTTGCISNYTYRNTKAGEKAIFNHSFAALVVEEDPEINSFHIRVLNCDNDGAFYDLDRYYSGGNMKMNNNIPAIVLGDEHVMNIDPAVTECTFGPEGICSKMKPEYIIRHDILDFHSGSHHHKNDFFMQYKKWLEGTNDVEAELKLTFEYLMNTTPVGSKSIIVNSNHNDHLQKWMNNVDIKTELWNVGIYFELMHLKIVAMKNDDDKDAFELWSKEHYTYNNIEFIPSDSSFKLFDIELSMHGHAGNNGSRGSVAQFSKLGHKTIVGHYHSPSIYNGAYSVGHSCFSKLEYNKGPSSWYQVHCLIHPNGKRQMVLITDGKWRR